MRIFARRSVAGRCPLWFLDWGRGWREGIFLLGRCAFARVEEGMDFFGGAFGLRGRFGCLRGWVESVVFEGSLEARRLRRCLLGVCRILCC